MHPGTRQLPAGRHGVAALFDALATVPENHLVLLARTYRSAEQAERDMAWERVRDAAAFHHRSGDIDAIREAAIEQVAVRHSAGDQRYAGSTLGLPSGVVMHDPLTQARIANAIVEAAGAVLVADVIDESTVELLAGPVLVLLDAAAEERAEEEQARLGRDDPPID